MSRRRWIVLTLVTLVGLFALGAWLGLRSADERARLDREASERARSERQARRVRVARRESADLMPDVLRGVALEMSIDEVRRARPAMQPAQAGFDDRALATFEERLPNGARVVYGFRSSRLERIQVLSLMPSVEAIGPHLAAMNARYGPPTGAWDCPQTGGVPTRRFTWRHAQTTVSDIFLIYGNRVSVTLYIAPTNIIASSLQRSACHPIAREELEVFPVATPEQMAQP